MMRPLKSFWTPPWMPFLAQRQKLQWKFWTQKEVFFLILILKSEAVLARCGCSLSTASVRDNAFTSKCLISCQESHLGGGAGPLFSLLHAVFLPLRTVASEKQQVSAIVRCGFFFLFPYPFVVLTEGETMLVRIYRQWFFPQGLKGCNYLSLLKRALKAQNRSPHWSVTRKGLKEEGMGEK